MLGADGELDPDYGLAEGSIQKLRAELANLASALGKTGAVRALRISPRKLASILSDQTYTDNVIAFELSAYLSVAKIEAEELCEEREVELRNIELMLQQLGLRGTARQLSVDPSNLRRKLTKSRFKDGDRN